MSRQRVGQRKVVTNALSASSIVNVYSAGNFSLIDLTYHAPTCLGNGYTSDACAACRRYRPSVVLSRRGAELL